MSKLLGAYNAQCASHYHGCLFIPLIKRFFLLPSFLLSFISFLRLLCFPFFVFFFLPLFLFLFYAPFHFVIIFIHSFISIQP